MDWFHSMTKWIDYNRGVVVGIILTVVFVAIMAGCQITTPSPVNPGTQVTAAELQIEATAAISRLDKQQAVLDAEREALAEGLAVAEADLQAKTEQRQALIEGVAGIGTMVAEGSVSTPSIIGAVTQLGLLLVGGGAMLDNRRKDTVIKKVKSGDPAPAS